MFWLFLLACTTTTIPLGPGKQRTGYTECFSANHFIVPRIKTTGQIVIYYQDDLTKAQLQATLQEAEIYIKACQR